jgi:predicted dehydrogenase
VPANLHYDLWLGPTPPRPYSPAYLPQVWRRWWAFGSGTLGDMACHYMDLPFWALKLRYPTAVSTEGPEVSEQECPRWLVVHYDFPARGELPPVKLSWYDGGKRPSAFEEWKLPGGWSNGVMFIGDKGQLVADYGRHKLLPEKDFADFRPPAPYIPDSLGHHREWIEACKKNDPSATTCSFDYSGPLTETVLLGDVAYRCGKPLQWDAATLTATNAPEAERFVKLRYREGWKL